MKKINKIDKYNIISYLIFIIIVIITIINYFYYDGGRYNFKNAREGYLLCTEYIKKNNDDKILMHDEYVNRIWLDDNYCQSLVNQKVLPYSAFKLYDDILFQNPLAYIIPFFVPFFILFPYMFYISKRFQSKDIKNYILREDYKRYVKELFKSAYKYIWCIPLCLVLVFLLSFMISRSLNPLTDINIDYLPSYIGELYYKPFFYISYVVILLLNMGIYINIGLIMISKNKNFIIAFVKSFLIIYFIYFCSEVFIGIFFQKRFNILTNYFNMLNIYTWRNINNIWFFLIINIIYYILTSIIAFYCYKNKEKILIMCEK